MGPRLRSLLESIGILIVEPDETAVVLRLGRIDGDRVRGTGRHLMLPIVDHAVRVDRRERHLRIPAIAVVDADGNARALDVAVRWQVVDPLMQVENIYGPEAGVRARTTIALTAGARETLRADPDSGVALAERVRETVAADAKRWGIEIRSVEILT